MTIGKMTARAVTLSAIMAFLISTFLVTSASARHCLDPRNQNCKYDNQGDQGGHKRGK
jgi:hypothetical protein